MAETLSEGIEQAAQPGQRPDGSTDLKISLQAVERLAQRHEITPGQVERQALAQQIWPERYIRNSRTLTAEDQAALLDATVAVVGLGGLGGTAVEILARLGVGTLAIIDGDTVEESNLNRQMVATRALIGTAKAEAAARRVEAINPAVSVCPHPQFLTAENAPALLSGAALAVDCLDTISSRLILEKAARSLGIPLVSGAVAGFSGQVTVVYPEDPGLAALYGDADKASDRGIETALGNLAPGVTIIAALQCTEALKVLLDRPGQLRNRLLLMDLADYSFDVMELG